MKFKDLINLYEDLKKKHGKESYKFISHLLEQAKIFHKKSWEKSPTPNKDHEQSWRAFKGKNLEKLILYIIKDQVEELGLKIIEGNILERKKSENLSEELSKVKRNLLVDFGEFGSHLPDVDLIIYEPQSYKIFAVISVKVTLRERIAQTGYWKIKLLQDPVTKNIKVIFITLDEDGTLTFKQPTKKGRAIAEIDIDKTYVMNEKEIQESDNIKKFDKFIIDLKTLLKK